MKSNTTRILAATVLVVVAIVIVALVGRDKNDSANTASSESPTASKTESASSSSSESKSGLTGEELADFSIKTADGKSLTTAQIKGPAVLHVMASWCPVCKTEAPTFSRFQKQNPQLNYYYLAVEDNPKDSLAFIKEFDLASGPVLVDRDRSVETALGLRGQPNTVFIDSKGRTQVIQGPGAATTLQEIADKIKAS